MNLWLTPMNCFLHLHRSFFITPQTPASLSHIFLYLIFFLSLYQTLPHIASFNFIPHTAKGFRLPLPNILPISSHFRSTPHPRKNQRPSWFLPHCTCVLFGEGMNYVEISRPLTRKGLYQNGMGKAMGSSLLHFFQLLLTR